MQDLFLLVLMGLAIIAISYIVFHWIILGSPAFGFTMTPELKVEAATVEFCIMYNMSDPTCDNLYGGIGPNIGGKH